MNNKSIKVRIAPSPTGHLHIGTARTALFNYLYARKNNGQFVLRIEDTDQERSKKKFEKSIIDGLKWLGMDWDGEIVYQSKRMKQGKYDKALKELIEKNLVYPCTCSPKELAEERKKQLSRGLPPRYSGKCRDKKPADVKKATYRLNVQKAVKELDLPEELEFTDLIRGKITTKASDLGDFILVKEDGTPLYHFAVVVDDHQHEMTHVIRGEDHISNTFNQLLLYSAFGWHPPQFGHLPLILDTDRSKLSKRKGNIVTIEQFKEEGYLPEALMNYMALLGWHPKGKEEVFSIKQAIKQFDLKSVNTSAAIFEDKKLNYLNGYYIRQTKDQDLLDLLINNYDWPEDKPDFSLKIVSLIKDRMKKLRDAETLGSYFFELPKYDSKLLVFKKSDQKKTTKGIEVALRGLENTKENDWNDQKAINKVLTNLVKENKLANGDLFWPVRVALSGLEASPSPAELLWVLGKEESTKRIQKALELMK